MRFFAHSLPIAVIPLLVLGAGAAAYDRTNRGEVADGVSVEGVDISGLRAPQARARLERELVAPLRRPVVVTAAGRRFELDPRRAGLRLDVDATVREALRRSREGTFVYRAVRDATGTREFKVALEATVAHDEAALRRLVRRVADAADREVRDASLGLTRTGPHPQAAQTGVTVRQDALLERLATAITSTDDRTVRAPVKTVEPKVPTGQLARRYPTIVVVDRDRFTLTLYKGLKKAKQFPIAVGAEGLETPPGRYAIENKQVDPVWSVPNSPWAGSLAGSVIPGGIPSNPLKARWLGVNGPVGIHGTAERDSMGKKASHGCVRMLPEDVIELYPDVPVGAPVYIA